MNRPTTPPNGYRARFTDTEQADQMYLALMNLLDQVHSGFRDKQIAKRPHLCRALNAADEALGNCGTYVPVED